MVNPIRRLLEEPVHQDVVLLYGCSFDRFEKGDVRVVCIGGDV